MDEFVLKNLLEEAFEAGYKSPLDMKSQIVTQILNKWKNSEDHYKIYTVADLKKFPEGTIFQHLVLGRCWIIEHKGNKQMQFADGKKVHFTQDGEPWDRPMRLMHTS